MARVPPVAASLVAAVGVTLLAYQVPPRESVARATMSAAGTRLGQGASDPLVAATLESYCTTCHNRRLRAGGLSLDLSGLDRAHEDAEVWERVSRKLRTHEMPPPGQPRPDAATYAAVASSIERALDDGAAGDPNPGLVPVHRLNRAEYANAIRDVLDLRLPAEALLFADQPDQSGFQNVASVLSVSPALLENYLSAASRISRLAIADPRTKPVIETYTIPNMMVQDDRADDAPFGSRGGLVARHHFPADGTYTVTIRLRRQLYLYLIGMGLTHQIDVRLDGRRVARFAVGGEAPGNTAPESFAGNTQGDPEWEDYMHTADGQLQVQVQVSAGTHEVGVSFVRQLWEREGVLQPPQRGFARTTNELYYDGYPAVDSVAIGGPHSPAGLPGDSPSRRRVFTCHPDEGAAEAGCAREILAAVATRAYRRPASAGEIDTLIAFYEDGRAEGGFEAGIQRGLERILVSPSFLFRVVRPPAAVASGETFSLGGLDLASRLSFFLWSSVPDDALREVAGRGELADPAVLEQQVRRMLRDPRSSALVDNFVTQWLHLGQVAGVVPDANAYPEFDENLREAMRTETRLFMASQLREDRSVMEMLTADYTYLNERLARHYGIPDVYGSHFRRVPLDGSVRGGLLGQASVLTVTSYPNRTSPVLRGKWLLETMLGAPPPAPPPDVPSLEESTPDGEARSLRERLELHRQNPACASCHARMDPLGFAMENFDALGKWRTESDGLPIDTRAVLPDGTAFEGFDGLRLLLAGREEDFVRTVSEHLLSYSLGRGIEYYDLPAVRRIARNAAAEDNQWSALVLGVVRSVPFSMGVVADELQ